MKDSDKTKHGQKIGNRVLIIGVSGSGKTTLARQLSKALKLPHVELDSIHWGANWTAAESSVFREKVEAVLSEGSWVCDGNYSAVRDITWSKADSIVWLDYPLTLIFWRLFWRSISRIVKREPLWNGNRESFSAQFLSKDSLFLWAFKTYFSYKRDYTELLKNPSYKRLATFQFSNSAQTEAWLAHLASRAN